MRIPLYPYQSEAVKLFLELVLAHPGALAVIVLPTGCGKTRTAIALVVELLSMFPDFRTLWLAHTEELIAQPMKAFKALAPELEVGAVQADVDHTAARHVVIASVPTIGRNGARLARLVEHQRIAGRFRFVVVDECHHAVAKSYANVLEAFPGVPVLGLTATPERADGKLLTKVFVDGAVFEYPIRAAIREGYLVQPVARRIVLPEFNPDEILRTKAGDFNEEDLEAKLLRANAAKATAVAAVEAAQSGRKVLAFCVRVSQAQATCEEVRAAGVRAEWLSGETPKRQRRRLLAAHAAGDFPVLVNCAVLTEGYDDPSLDAIVMARPTLSRTLYKQIVGRGLRPDPARPIGAAEGKNDCLIYDLVGAEQAHGILTIDSLLYAEEEEEEAKAGEAAKRKKKLDEEVARLPDDAEARRLRTFLAYVSGQMELEGVSTKEPVKWLVVAREACYIFGAGEDGSILVERDRGGGWHAILEPSNHREDPIQLTEAPTSRELAQAVGEGYARMIGAMKLSRRDAAWRSRAPSEGLLRALKGFRVEVPADQPITAGQASDLLKIAIGRARFNNRRRRVPRPRIVRRPTGTFYVDL